tara:strand:- start:58 stop:276 length:219 start_codon:yes stop_codon:yes gene_type:complete
MHSPPNLLAAATAPILAVVSSTADEIPKIRQGIPISISCFHPRIFGRRKVVIISSVVKLPINEKFSIPILWT